MTAEPRTSREGRRLTGFVLVVAALLLLGLAYRAHRDAVDAWEGYQPPPLRGQVFGDEHPTRYNPEPRPSSGGLTVAAVVAGLMVVAGLVLWVEGEEPLT